MRKRYKVPGFSEYRVVTRYQRWGKTSVRLNVEAEGGIKNDLHIVVRKTREPGKERVVGGSY